MIRASVAFSYWPGASAGVNVSCALFFASSSRSCRLANRSASSPVSGFPRPK